MAMRTITKLKPSLNEELQNLIKTLNIGGIGVEPPEFEKRQEYNQGVRDCIKLLKERKIL